MKKLARLKAGTIGKGMFNKTLDNYCTTYCGDLVPCVRELWKIIFPEGERWRTEDYGLYSWMKMSLEQARDNLLAQQIM